MSPIQTPETNVAMRTEAGDLEGWLSDEDAHQLIVAGLATMSQPGRKRRTIIRIAAVEAPLDPNSRRQALASYFGKTIRSTYREHVSDGLPPVIAMKRAVLNQGGEPTGELAKW